MLIAQGYKRNHMLKYRKNNRFALVVLMMFLFISLALIIRIILMFTSFDQVDLGILVLIKVFFVGAIYDFIAVTYYLAPLAVYITLMPNRLFNNRFHKYIFWLFLFVQINLLVFDIFSEWFFWEEFGRRFDFIAVDYLVYTHEVVHNILESYPIPLLMGLVFIISSCLFYLVYKKTSILDSAFDSSQNFLQRLKIGVCFIFLPILFFFIINEQSLANISANQFDNELSKDGLYSLFSAFRNNTLDYDTHYKTESAETIMSHLNTLYKFDSNYSRFIKKTGGELKYNVMLVMVESLSAEYMGAFGDDRGWAPNLDNLAKRSLFFDNFYATGTRTDRGMEAVVLSVPPTPGRSIIKRPDCYDMFSAGFIFKKKAMKTNSFMPDMVILTT